MRNYDSGPIEGGEQAIQHSRETSQGEDRFEQVEVLATNVADHPQRLQYTGQFAHGETNDDFSPNKSRKQRTTNNMKAEVTNKRRAPGLMSNEEFYHDEEMERIQN